MLNMIQELLKITWVSFFQCTIEWVQKIAVEKEQADYLHR